MEPLHQYEFVYRRGEVLHRTAVPSVDRDHAERFARAWCDMFNCEWVRSAGLETPELRALMVNDFEAVRRLPTGELAGCRPQLFTTSLCVGVDDEAYRTRYCYERAEDAKAALTQWDGAGDPPGPWIKQKPEERLGPGART